MILFSNVERDELRVATTFITLEMNGSLLLVFFSLLFHRVITSQHGIGFERIFVDSITTNPKLTMHRAEKKEPKLK